MTYARIWLSMPLFALMLLDPNGANAGKQLDSCKSDRARLCPGLPRHECRLGKYVGQLSTMCRVTIEPEMKRRGKSPRQDASKGGGACAVDRKRLCAGSSRGDCNLRKMLTELSPACRARVQQRQATR